MRRRMQRHACADLARPWRDPTRRSRSRESIVSSIWRLRHIKLRAGHRGIKSARSRYDAWLAIAETADWKTPEDVKKAHPKASVLRGGRVVFNIKADDYRLIALVQYVDGVLMIRFFGSHDGYDGIDADHADAKKLIEKLMDERLWRRCESGSRRIHLGVRGYCLTGCPGKLCGSVFLQHIVTNSDFNIDSINLHLLIVY